MTIPWPILRAHSLRRSRHGDLFQPPRPHWVSEYQARLIRETPLSSDMQLQEVEDGFHLSATVTNTWQLRWWILSLGDALVVHEPPALRQQIAGTLQRAAAAYGPA